MLHSLSLLLLFFSLKETELKVLCDFKARAVVPVLPFSVTEGCGGTDTSPACLTGARDKQETPQD